MVLGVVCAFVVTLDTNHARCALCYDPPCRIGDETARSDALQLAEITARDLRGLNAQLGPILVTLLGLILGFLAALGFYYDSPLAQSVFFLVMPAVGVGYLRTRLAQAWPQIPPQDQIRALMRHRRRLQVLGSVLIFFTAIWGVFFLQRVPQSPL